MSVLGVIELGVEGVKDDCHLLIWRFFFMLEFGTDLGIDL